MFAELEQRIEKLGICDENGTILDALINNPEMTDEEMKEMEGA